jgi:hypothetical protein
MYTIKGFLDEHGTSATLSSAKDWTEAQEKAAELRKQGLIIEIWHEDGMKVEEPEKD